MAALQDDPEKQFALAIRNFQEFAGLNVTGRLTDATWIDTDLNINIYLFNIKLYTKYKYTRRKE